jgi:hypothetical protein
MKRKRTKYPNMRRYMSKIANKISKYEKEQYIRL